jgi:hypothetical protein
MGVNNKLIIIRRSRREWRKNSGISGGEDDGG